MCYRWSWVVSIRKYSQLYFISPVSVLLRFLIRANSFSACAVLYLTCVGVEVQQKLKTFIQVQQTVISDHALNVCSSQRGAELWVTAHG